MRIRAYAAEELIAELGAAFVCAHLGLSTEPREDHAQYIQSWLKVLRADKRAIFTAASKAQQAADYLTARAEERAKRAAGWQHEAGNGSGTGGGGDQPRQQDMGADVVPSPSLDQAREYIRASKAANTLRGYGERLANILRLV